MIRTLLRISLINLRRDRVVQAMTFVLPIVFFSIFAAVFGRQGGGVTERIRVAVVDEDRSEASGRLVKALREEAGLRVRTEARGPGSPPDAPALPIDRARAEEMVKNGDVPVAVVLPAGWGASAGGFDAQGPAVELLSDSSDPIAPQVVSGLLQRAGMTAAPERFARQGIAQFERYGGELTARQRRAVDSWLSRSEQPIGPVPDSAAGDSGFAGLPGDSTLAGLLGGSGRAAAGDSNRAAAGTVRVKMVDVLGRSKANPAVAFYAAGIAVMFLLFMASGAGGTLLDEVESGTLERLLTSNLNMGRLLAGKWLFITFFGILQVTVMFAWGALAFRLDLLRHLPGFFVMTGATAAAAAGLGLVLATLCRSRAQLSGIATILILSMSALGGSMFPRFLMSEGMQRIGLFTFNAWALDGYTKVFWREAPVQDLWPQLALLAGMTLVFLTIARWLARRWETI